MKIWAFWERKYRNQSETIIYSLKDNYIIYGRSKFDIGEQEE